MKVCGTVHLVNLGEADCWELRADDGKTYITRGASPDFKEGLRVEVIFSHVDHMPPSAYGGRDVAIMDSYSIVK